MEFKHIEFSSVDKNYEVNLGSTDISLLKKGDSLSWYCTRYNVSFTVEYMAESSVSYCYFEPTHNEYKLHLHEFASAKDIKMRSKDPEFAGLVSVIMEQGE